MTEYVTKALEWQHKNVFDKPDSQDRFSAQLDEFLNVYGRKGFKFVRLQKLGERFERKSKFTEDGYFIMYFLAIMEKEINE